MRSDASGAKIHLLGFTVYHDRRRMDIRVKTAVCMVFGMADILTEHRCFPTDITLQDVFSLELLAVALQTSVQ